MFFKFILFAILINCSLQRFIPRIHHSNTTQRCKGEVHNFESCLNSTCPILYNLIWNYDEQTSMIEILFNYTRGDQIVVLSLTDSQLTAPTIDEHYLNMFENHLYWYYEDIGTKYVRLQDTLVRITHWINIRELKCRTIGVFVYNVNENGTSLAYKDAGHRDICTDNCEGCYQPIKMGLFCNNAQYKWYYDRDEDKCMQHVYHGCERIENNFNSYDECVQKCKSGSENGVSHNYNETKALMEILGGVFEPSFLDEDGESEIRRQCELLETSWGLNDFRHELNLIARLIFNLMRYAKEDYEDFGQDKQEALFYLRSMCYLYYDETELFQIFGASPKHSRTFKRDDNSGSVNTSLCDYNVPHEILRMLSSAMNGIDNLYPENWYEQVIPNRSEIEMLINEFFSANWDFFNLTIGLYHFNNSDGLISFIRSNFVLPSYSICTNRTLLDMIIDYILVNAELGGNATRLRRSNIAANDGIVTGTTDTAIVTTSFVNTTGSGDLNTTSVQSSESSTVYDTTNVDTTTTTDTTSITTTMTTTTISNTSFVGLLNETLVITTPINMLLNDSNFIENITEIMENATDVHNLTSVASANIENSTTIEMNVENVTTIAATMSSEASEVTVSVLDITTSSPPTIMNQTEMTTTDSVNSTMSQEETTILSTTTYSTTTTTSQMEIVYTTTMLPIVSNQDIDTYNLTNVNETMTGAMNVANGSIDNNVSLEIANITVLENPESSDSKKYALRLHIKGYKWNDKFNDVSSDESMEFLKDKILPLLVENLHISLNDLRDVKLLRLLKSKSQAGVTVN